MWEKQNLEPKASEILSALEVWKHGKHWQDQHGKFVCAIERWLSDQKYLETPEPSDKDSGELSLDTPDRTFAEYQKLMGQT